MSQPTNAPSLLSRLAPAGLRAAARRGLTRLADATLGEAVLRKSVRKEGWPDVPGVSLHLLLSARTWRMGVFSIRGFEAVTRRRWPLWLHDDGTLTPEMLAQLRRIFPEARMTTRQERDAAMNEHFANFPFCRRGRESHAFFQKFLDPWHFAPERKYISMDADVLFFRPPEEILAWADSDAEGCHFMPDRNNGYSFQVDELERRFGAPLWQFINAGLGLMVRDAVTPEFCEEFFSEYLDRPCRRPFLLEQTLTALCVARWGRGGGLLPESYSISQTFLSRPGAVARHYIGISKDDTLFLDGLPRVWRNVAGWSRPVKAIPRG